MRTDGATKALGPCFGCHQPQSVIWPLPHTQANFWQQLNDPVLNQLLAQTLSDAPDLAATRARIDGAAAQYGLARSQTGPQIAADGTFNRQRFSEYGMYAGLFGGQYMNSFRFVAQRRMGI
jgi:outer membrane protein TolC